MIRLRVIEGPNARDQFLVEVQTNADYIDSLHTCDVCVITTWVLGLRATRGAPNSNPDTGLRIIFRQWLDNKERTKKCSLVSDCSKFRKCSFKVIAKNITPYIDCKTVRIFVYSSTREQSNERSIHFSQFYLSKLFLYTQSVVRVLYLVRVLYSVPSFYSPFYTIF